MTSECMKNMIFLACRQMPRGCQSVNGRFLLSLQRVIVKQLRAWHEKAFHYVRMVVRVGVIPPFAAAITVISTAEDGICACQMPSLTVPNAVYCTVECRLWRCALWNTVVKVAVSS